LIEPTKASSTTFDVIVVGAGLAGLTVANICYAAGLNVLVLEASDRSCGRVWTKSLPSHPTPVDWGAEWIIPNLHNEVMAIVASAGMTVSPENPARKVRWITRKKTYHGSYASLKLSNPNFAKALRKIEADAQEWSNGRRQSTSVETSLQNYFHAIAANEDTADLLEAAVFPLTGADPAQVATRMLWDEIIFHDSSVDDTLDANAYRIEEGCGTLAKTLTKTLQSSILYNSPVSKITSQGDGFNIECGQHLFQTRQCVIAVPLSAFQGIELGSVIPSEMIETARMANAGRVAKTWAHVDATEPPPDVLHVDGALRYGYARQLNNGQWLVCGQILSNGHQTITAEGAAALIVKAWPKIVVRSIEVLDWPQHIWARASWHSSRAGWSGDMGKFHTSMGKLHFAGGDIAKRWAGWMEGAILSGREIGQRIVAIAS
jgi:monoamine oxidase